MSETSARWLDPAEKAAWLSYRQMTRLLDAQLASDLQADSGLSESDYDVLGTLNDSEVTWCLKDLGARLLWSQSRLSHHIARMAARGLVERLLCPTDGRGTDVAITPAGREAIVVAAPGHVESVRRHFFDHLNAADIKALTGIGEKINEHLRAGLDQTRI
ncbi:MarR family winged helix-turn-helix transcriptional regulator [Amycolatopsis pigmentata]|uniref:MarR family winged helix-turn-helix transcriptional regulator n=1 Tax=Amycolatopsis pigmentata TaxID=450801 RepID=A0ABW5FM85_9PSEU